MRVVDVLLFCCVAMTLATANAVQVCPEKCECQSDAIACRGLLSFPERWPDNISRIGILHSALHEIPPGAFANMAALRRIMITNTNISHIRNCSFSRLSRVLVSFEHCVIDTIDSYAFSYLYNTSLSFGASSMRIISPYAFTRSQKGENWDFIGVNITSAEPRAFYNLSKISSLNFMTSTFHEVKSLSMSMLNGVESVIVADNRIDFLYCRTFEEVARTAEFFGFYDNELYCDCRLEWLFTSGILTAQGRVENRCHGPQSMIGQGYGSSLGNLTGKDLPCDKDDFRDKTCQKLSVPDDPEPQCYFTKEIISTTPLSSIQTTLLHSTMTTSAPMSEQHAQEFLANTTLPSAETTSEISSSISSTAEVTTTTADLTTSPSPKRSTVSIFTTVKFLANTTLPSAETTSEISSSISSTAEVTTTTADLTTSPSPKRSTVSIFTTVKFLANTTLPSAETTSEISSSISSTAQVTTTTADLTTSPSPKRSTISIFTTVKASTDAPKTPTFIYTTDRQNTKTTHESTSKSTISDTTSRPRTTSRAMNPSTTDRVTTIWARTPTQIDESPSTEKAAENSPTNNIPNSSIKDDDITKVDVTALIIDSSDNNNGDNDDDHDASIDGIDRRTVEGLAETSSASPVPVVIESRVTVPKTDKERMSARVTSPSQRTRAPVFVLIATLVLLAL